MHWTQVYDPLGHWWLSTIVAALPIVVLLGLLAGFKVRPHLAAIAGAVTALLVSVLVFKMPWQLSAMSFVYGLSFGLLKIVWIVVAAVYLYELTVHTGHFEIIEVERGPGDEPGILLTTDALAKQSFGFGDGGRHDYAPCAFAAALTALTMC